MRHNPVKTGLWRNSKIRLFVCFAVAALPEYTGYHEVRNSPALPVYLYEKPITQSLCCKFIPDLNLSFSLLLP